MLGRDQIVEMGTKILQNFFQRKEEVLKTQPIARSASGKSTRLPLAEWFTEKPA